MTQAKKIILTIVVGIVVLSYISWSYLLKPCMLWDETFWNNRPAFWSAISLYRCKFDRLPTSLEEMVTTGFLPEKSNIYSCPVIHGNRYGKMLPYNECEYTFTFDPNEIVIYVPEKVFDHWPYSRIEENRRRWVIRKEYK